MGFGVTVEGSAYLAKMLVPFLVLQGLVSPWENPKLCSQRRAEAFSCTWGYSSLIVPTVDNLSSEACRSSTPDPRSTFL